MLSPLTGKTESFVKNSGHFVQRIKSLDLQSSEIMVSFDIVSLFTIVPVNEALHVIKERLKDDTTLEERSALPVESMMELLEVCLKTTYFQVGDKFYQQKEDMAVGSSLSPTVSSIYMEFFENLALNSAHYKPSLWLRYVDDTFVIWPHGPQLLQNFFCYLNSLRPSIHFTMET
jgi:hypothetical protein